MSKNVSSGLKSSVGDHRVVFISKSPCLFSFVTALVLMLACFQDVRISSIL